MKAISGWALVRETGQARGQLMPEMVSPGLPKRFPIFSNRRDADLRREVWSEAAGRKFKVVRVRIRREK